MNRISDSLSAVLCKLLLLVFAFPVAGVGAAMDTSIDLEDYRGRVVLLDFWASWCVPCRRSFPWMNVMQQKYAGQGLVIIAVNMDTEPDEAQAFLENFPAEFRIIHDPGGHLATRFGVVAMPSSYVIDRGGNVVARHLGFKVKDQDEYEATIRTVLADPIKEIP